MPENAQDLKKHSCLHYGYLATGQQWQLISQETEEMVLIDGVFCSNNGEVLRNAAVSGLGIVVLPKFIVAEELRKGNLEIILPNYQSPELTLCVIYPVNRHISQKVQLFTQFLQEKFYSEIC